MHPHWYGLIFHDFLHGGWSGLCDWCQMHFCILLASNSSNSLYMRKPKLNLILNVIQTCSNQNGKKLKEKYALKKIKILHKKIL